MLHDGSWEGSVCVILLCDKGKMDTQVSPLNPLNWVSHGQSEPLVMSDASWFYVLMQTALKPGREIASLNA